MNQNFVDIIQDPKIFKQYENYLAENGPEALVQKVRSEGYKIDRDELLALFADKELSLESLDDVAGGRVNPVKP